MTLLAEQELGADAATITISSLPTTFKDLLILAGLRGDVAAHADDLGFRVGNGGLDSGTNYSFNNADGTRPGAASEFTIDNNGMPGASADADVFSSTVIWILNYADPTDYRGVLARSGGRWSATAPANVGDMFGHWRNTADAIDTFGFVQVGSSTNFVTGSFVRVYGYG